jgi:hypothetical protein
MASYFWSGSTVSNLTNYAWYVYLAYGYTNYDFKGTTTSVICVRP